MVDEWSHIYVLCTYVKSNILKKNIKIGRLKEAGKLDTLFNASWLFIETSELKIFFNFSQLLEFHNWLFIEISRFH